MARDITAVIGKLLAQAEDPKTPETVRAALQDKIQRLATTNAISLAEARMRQGASNRRETPVTKNIVLGQRGQYMLKFRPELMSAIANSNDLRMTIAHNNTFVNLCGFPSDIAVAELLYNSLLIQMVAEADRAIKRGDHKLEWANNRRGYVDARVYRSSFYDSFTSRIRYRLANARREAIAERKAEEEAINARLSRAAAEEALANGAEPAPAPEASVGTALVIATKAEEVKEHFDSTIGKHAKGTWKRAESKGYSSRGRESGNEAGRRARITPNAELASRKALVS